jgi:aminopeptidase N
LLDRLRGAYSQLKPVDQLGLLADNWALGLAGYQPTTAALGLLDTIPLDGNTKVWGRAAEILTDLYDRYEGDAEAQTAVAQYGSAKLRPVFERLGWIIRPNEKPNDAVLRNELIIALGRFGDADVVAEAKRRYSTGDASATSGPLRTAILDVIAWQADSATWDRLHSEAKEEKKPLVRQRLYALLGGSRDETLARQALELSLTDEPGTTTSSQIVAAVAESHPDLAYDFAIANREKVEAQVDVSSRSRYFPRLAGRSSNAAMVTKLEDYAQRFMTPQSRKSADVAIAAIKDRIRVRETRLKEVAAWFKEHH